MSLNFGNVLVYIIALLVTISDTCTDLDYRSFSTRTTTVATTTNGNEKKLERAKLTDADLFELLLHIRDEYYICESDFQIKRCNQFDWYGETISIKYYIYTRDNQDAPTVLTQDSLSKNTSSYQIDRDVPIVLLAHGYTSNYNSSVVKKLVSGILDGFDVNIIVIDWSENIYDSKFHLSGNFPEVDSEIDQFHTIQEWRCCINSNSVLIGKNIVEFMEYLKIDSSQCTLIGHGYAAHLFGVVGSLSKTKPATIVALDPIKLAEASKDTHLDQSDAEFVHVIHTSNKIGTEEAIGHADYYVRENVSYSNDMSVFDILERSDRIRDIIEDIDVDVNYVEIVPHYTVVDYYIESLSAIGFIARRCENWVSYNNYSCEFNPESVMGRFYVDRTASGKYYLDVNAEMSFSKTSCLDRPHCSRYNFMDNFNSILYDQVKQKKNEVIPFLPTKADLFEILFYGKDESYSCKDVVKTGQCARSKLSANKSTMKYFLHTRNNPDKPIVLKQHEATSIESLNGKPNVFLAHGYLSRYDSIFNKLIISEILKHHDVNVFAVEWGDVAYRKFIQNPKTSDSRVLRFLQESKCCSKNYAKSVGHSIGNFIHALMLNFNISSKEFLLIGHSLGAHVQRYAAAEVKSVSKSPVLSVVALAPSNITHDMNKMTHCCDAEIVHAIHKDSDYDGASFGDADYYIKIPNCPSKDSWSLAAIGVLRVLTYPNITFDHETIRFNHYVMKIYAETISSFRFISTQIHCTNCYVICDDYDNSVLGRLFVDQRASGKYRVLSEDDCLDDSYCTWFQ